MGCEDPVISELKGVKGPIPDTQSETQTHSTTISLETDVFHVDYEPPVIVDEIGSLARH